MTTDESMLVASREALLLTLLDLADLYGTTAVADAVAELWPGYRPDSFPARAHDPRTSQTAAARFATRDVTRFRRGSLAARMLEVFAEAPCTALDAARTASGVNTPLGTESARKRASELHAARFIQAIGIGHSEGSPDEATLWQVTVEGQDALRNLAASGWSR